MLIRRYTVKLSVIRGLIKEAKRRKELGITTTIKEELAQEAAANPVVLLDGSLQADILNDLCGVRDRLGKVQQALGLGCSWAAAPLDRANFTGLVLGCIEANISFMLFLEPSETYPQTFLGSGSSRKVMLVF